MIKVIGIDLGGVYLTNGFFKEGRAVVRGEGVEFEESEMKEYTKLASIGEIDENELLKHFVGDDVEKIERIKTKVREFNGFLFPELREWIKTLRRKYKVVAMNNEIKGLNDFRIEKFGIRALFDDVFSSCDIGLMKPNREYFDFVLDKLAIKAEEMFFVDDYEGNVVAAKEIGIRALLFENPQKLMDETKDIL